MADVRALLRQQRAARRIEHPHAAYSDAGKLLCTVCHEHIKVESLWEGHLRSLGHRQRVQTKASENAKENGHSGAGNTQNGGTQSLKRKMDDDVVMGDGDDQVPQEDTMRKKRSKPDMTLGDLSPAKKGDRASSTSSGSNPNHKPITPPFTRRQSSGTPTLGVEMQIPSRPATPGAMPQSAGSSAGGTSTATTPKTAGPFGRSPLIPQDPSAVSMASQLPPKLEPASQPVPPVPSQGAPPNITSNAGVDEDLWAAFEADLVRDTSSTAPAAVQRGAAANESISAPAISSEEQAARSEEDARNKRRAAADVQIEDEREEAKRALETEFEVMEELEARAKKLRERREALRLRHTGGVSGEANDETGSGAGKTGVSTTDALGKENAPEGEDDEDDDEEDEVDDWVGFRFRS